MGLESASRGDCEVDKMLDTTNDGVEEDEDTLDLVDDVDDFDKDDGADTMCT